MGASSPDWEERAKLSGSQGAEMDAAFRDSRIERGMEDDSL